MKYLRTFACGLVIASFGMALPAFAAKGGNSAGHRQDGTHGHHKGGNKGGNSAGHRQDGTHGHHKGGNSAGHSNKDGSKHPHGSDTKP